MKSIDKVKILDDRIKTQYDLNREAAKISALSSNNLDNYEYLTGEGLEYKTSVVEKIWIFLIRNGFNW